MVFGRLLSRRSKDQTPSYGGAPGSPTYSTSSSFTAVPEYVPPAYPIDGRLNKHNNNINIDSKPYPMPNFPIMANVANERTQPRMLAKANNNTIARKPVSYEDHQRNNSSPDQVPRPSFSPFEDTPTAQLTPPSQPHLHPVSIPIPHQTTTSKPSHRKSSSFLSSISPFTSSPSTKPSSTSSSSTPITLPIPATEIRRCTRLLRRMYELTLDMWSMRSVYEVDKAERLEKKRQADAILVEIQNMVETWTATTDADWSAEEWRQVVYIRGLLDRLGGGRFW